MNPSTCISFFFTIILILNISHAISPNSGSKLYENVCNKAKDNERCLKLLESNTQITLAKDYLTICKLFLEMALEKSKNAQNILKTFMIQNPSSLAIKQCATDDYNGLITSFKSSLDELVDDPLSANYDAKVAGDGPQACDRALANEKIVNPSISTINDEMTFLSVVGYLATSYLRQ
ncbi:uncharacterized protein [Cicer arietinum]|uniref:uncharacterized protein n=1 Tax=Cicer arietinum TaxID=3827 RepID=UPI00032A6D86